ncbi:MAG TPA: sulfotransferase [Nocardioidaceae bacterium]|nr:sulfotransferase [Nocardioidaceae bacterium]
MTDARRLVFIGGLHRSGTTPLARVLAAHPEVSGLTGTGVREDEGQHLQQVYPRAKLYGGSGRFAFDPRAHLTESSSLVSQDSAAAMLAAWEPYWDMSTPYLLEKSPPNLLMGRFLQALFPGSALVVVVRHPVVVALSTKKWRRAASRHPGKYMALSALVEHWLAAHRLLLADAPHLGRLLVVRYEDLVSQPDAELARVQGFLGLTSPIPAAGLSDSRSQRYVERWESLRLPWRPGWWQRQRIERRLAAAIAGFGYDVSDLSAPGSWPATPPTQLDERHPG